MHLSAQPACTALYYVWGNATDRLPITFNGKPNIRITRSLHVALEHTHQIPLMGAISKNATEACIWLGPARPYAPKSGAANKAGRSPPRRQQIGDSRFCSLLAPGITQDAGLELAMDMDPLTNDSSIWQVYSDAYASPPS